MLNPSSFTNSFIALEKVESTDQDKMGTFKYQSKNTITIDDFLVSESPSHHLIRFNVGIDSLSAALECLPGVSEILQQNLTNITIFPLQRSPTEPKKGGGYML